MAHEFDGEKYARASSHQQEWGQRLIAELSLRGSEMVLDLGCGDGALTARLASLLPQGEAVGIDASQGMIEAAQKKQGRNLRFLLMNINDLDFKEEFDIVFSNATLHWIMDHRRLLANVRRALRPGGFLRFNFAGDGNCAGFFKVIRQAMALERFSSYFADFQWPWYMPLLREYEALVRQSGLYEIKVWGENADRFFPDAGAMTRWVDQPSLVPFIACVGEDDKPAFREFVVARMIDETRQADGRCFETFRRINVYAKRKEGIDGGDRT